MPQSSRRGVAHDIVSLAEKRMGLGNAVFYAPSIPPGKEAGARRVHALHLPESEPILVLYDGTVFGSATEGFLATAERLCWKNLLEHPRQILWCDLDPATIVPDSSTLGVAGGSIDVAGGVVPGAAGFLVEMATRYGPAEGGPYRRGADAAPETPAGVILATSRLTALARRHLGEVEDLYYHPAIPSAKLRKATAAHAAHLAPDEVVAVLYDDTIFGSAEEGFFLTSRRLCWKNLTGGVESAAWTAIEPDSISPSGNLVYVMTGAIQFTTKRALAVPVARLLTAIAVEARGGRPAT
jgi:hypothetical protein